jgi:hypothetical protein
MKLLPPDQARRCMCGEPNTTGLCCYPSGKCPREQPDCLTCEDDGWVERVDGLGGVVPCPDCSAALDTAIRFNGGCTHWTPLNEPCPACDGTQEPHD